MTKKVVNLNEAGEPVGTIGFTFDDGTSVEFDMSKVNDATRARLALHGASQKIGDSYASAAKEADPVAFAKMAVEETIAQLYAGTWRANAGGGGPRVSDLALAFSQVSGDSVEEAQKYIETLTPEQVKTLKAKKKIAAALLAISAQRAAERAERAQAKLAAAGAAAGDDDEEDLSV